MIYPILGFVDNDNMIYVFQNGQHFESTSFEIFNQDKNQSQKYIDSEGCVYKIKNVENLGFKGFFGFSLLLKGRQIKIRTEFYSVTEKVSLEDLKSELLEKIDKKKSYWKTSWDISELKQQINIAGNFKELFLILK